MTTRVHRSNEYCSCCILHHMHCIYLIITDCIMVYSAYITLLAIVCLRIKIQWWEFWNISYLQKEFLHDFSLPSTQYWSFLDSFAPRFFLLVFNYMPHIIIWYVTQKCNSEFMRIRCFTFRCIVCCRARIFDSKILLYVCLFNNKWYFICEWLQRSKSYTHVCTSIYEDKKREIFLFHIFFRLLFDFDRFHPKVGRTQ